MATEDELIGSLVDGRYTVIEPMASGSMGAVYKAERVPVGKLVAIKFLHASYANDAEFLGRFERETRVMSKLAHPNCVSVVDFGVWQGAPYLVMEYVGGRTLRKIIDQGALPVPRALTIARQIAAGLAHAHAQGITHRDVKPANIMISEEIGTGEHVRILDFGLARLRGAGGRDATQSNVVVGTPNYMAPEQTIGGGTIDERTDIYAVGVVLFEMIAGERPFQAEDTLALLGMHRAAPIPRIADRAPVGVELPEGIQDVIETAMAKSPNDRYESAIALADAIDGLASRATPLEIKSRMSSQYDTVAVAPTLVDLSTQGAPPLASYPGPSKKPRKHSSSRAGVIVALAVLAGGAYAAYYTVSGKDAEKTGEVAQAPGSAAAPEPAPSVAPGSGSSAEAAAGSSDGSSGGSSDGQGDGSGSSAPADPAASGSGSSDAGSNSGSAAPSEAGGSAVAIVGSGSSAAEPDEIEMEPPDPDKATNPDPAAPAQTADDEAEDAPKTQADVEKRIAAAPVLATTIRAAVRLIQDGKRELAMASLQKLQTRSPKNAYIAFLLGNLYFDKMWWSVAMDHYRAAISHHGGYRRNATLIRNVIRMLGSSKTDDKAAAFLRRTIGKPAGGYLQQAARTESNPRLRKHAAYIARQLR